MGVMDATGQLSPVQSGHEGDFTTLVLGERHRGQVLGDVGGLVLGRPAVGATRVVLEPGE